MRRAAAVLLAAAPLTLAACGGGGSSSSSTKLTPSAYVMQAAKKSAAATSEHVTMDVKTSVNGQPVAMTGNGDFDNPNHVGELTMHAGVQGIDLQIDAILSGTTMYMKAPVFAAALPNGKSWLKIDLQKVGQKNGIDFQSLLAQSPTSTLATLKASGAVTDVGDETVGGAATTHYRVAIDPSKLPQGTKIEALTKAKYGPYDVWIGKDDGYVHKLTSSYSYATPTGGRQSVTMTMTFSDFGKSVTVNVPPSDEVFDATNASIKGIGG
jgi:hypothetical protein